MSDKYYGSCEAVQVYVPGNVTESDNQDLYTPGSAAAGGK
jgi:hypothetical protein